MRRRMLNPDFFTDPDIVATLDAFGRLFYQGLWCVADDSGCFEFNPLFLKMKIFPGDNISLDTIQGFLDILIGNKKLIKYQVNGKEYAWLKNFHKHQKLDKPSPPSNPLPHWIVWHGEEELGSQRHKWYYEVKEPIGDNSGTIRGHVGDTTTPEEKLSKEKLSKEKEKEIRPNSSSPDPSPDQPDQSIDHNKEPDNQEDGQKEPDIKFTSESRPFKAAAYLRKKILENNPKAKVPNEDPADKLMQKWATDLDRLNRIGPPGKDPKENHGYNWEEIAEIINYCQDDEFWQGNILSASKLREQAVKLENQMKRQHPRGDPKNKKGVGLNGESGERFKKDRFAGLARDAGTGRLLDEENG